MSETIPAPAGSGATPPPFLEPPPIVTPAPFVPSSFAAPAEPLVPWISIWTRPRATLRQVLDRDPRRWVFRLAALGGTAGALNFAPTAGFGDTYPAALVLAVVLVGGALGGILGLLVFTILVRVAGRWLGGRGGTREVMAALAWSCVPSIWGLVLWLPRAALLGEETFQPQPPGLEGNPAAAILFRLLQLAGALAGIWGFLVTLKCIAEAHEFSSWRALWTYVLMGLMVAVPVGLLLLAGQVFS